MREGKAEGRGGGKVMILITEKLIVKLGKEGQPQSYFLRVQGVRNLYGKRRPWSTLATDRQSFHSLGQQERCELLLLLLQNL